MPDLGCWGGDIVSHDADGYRPQTVLLKCKCGKMYWQTKNIGYIGARNIFSFPGGCEWMKTQHYETKGEHECSCSGHDLVLATELMEHVKHCDVCKHYGF